MKIFNTQKYTKKKFESLDTKVSSLIQNLLTLCSLCKQEKRNNNTLW